MIVFESEDYRDSAALSWYLTSSVMRDNPLLSVMRQPRGSLLGLLPGYSKWWDFEKKVWFQTTEEERIPKGSFSFRRDSDSLSRYEVLETAKAWVKDLFPEDACCWASYMGGFDVFPDTKDPSRFYLEMTGVIVS